MYKDSTTRQQELLDEAAGLLGMIAEVKSKALLLKHKNKRKMANCMAGLPEEPTEVWEEEVGMSVDQMYEDLAKYQDRIDVILEELAEYGIDVS